MTASKPENGFSHHKGSLPFSPEPGMILMCNFDAGPGKIPGIEKIRPVVIISAPADGFKLLCIAVPITSAVRETVSRHHFKIPDRVHYRRNYFDDKGSMVNGWVLCDLVATVSCEQLNRVKLNGEYAVPYLTPQDFSQVLNKVVVAIKGE